MASMALVLLWAFVPSGTQAQESASSTDDGFPLWHVQLSTGWSRVVDPELYQLARNIHNNAPTLVIGAGRSLDTWLEVGATFSVPGNKNREDRTKWLRSRPQYMLDARLSLMLISDPSMSFGFEMIAGTTTGLKYHYYSWPKLNHFAGAVRCRFRVNGNWNGLVLLERGAWTEKLRYDPLRKSELVLHQFELRFGVYYSLTVEDGFGK